MRQTSTLRYDLAWKRGNVLALIVACLLCAGALAAEAVHKARPTGLVIVVDPSRIAAASQRVDPNTATEASLRRLPEIGPVTAGAIVEFRRTHSRAFRTADDLKQVRGIGPYTLRRIAPYLAIPAGR